MSNNGCGTVSFIGLDTQAKKIQKIHILTPNSFNQNTKSSKNVVLCEVCYI